MMIEDLLDQWSTMIRNAAAGSSRLAIRGGSSKAGYGNAVKRADQVIDTTGWSGVVGYAPEELVVTARAGTPLAELEAELVAAGQMLPFEPPHFAGGATLGGAIAAGLAGPRRPYAGTVHDSVLGVQMIDGLGRQLRFGGQVVKNVAGFDVARFLTGSLGTLGLLTEVSLKLVPRPQREATVVLALTPDEASARLASWRRTPFPISASAYVDQHLFVRLAGSEALVGQQVKQLGGEVMAQSDAFWRDVRDHQHPFFHTRTDAVLMRLSVRPDAPQLPVTHDAFVEWGGALRWIWAEADDIEPMRAWTKSNGGHATLFSGPASVLEAHGVFAPLPAPHLELLERIKAVFDPAGIFNPGRMYPSL